MHINWRKYIEKTSDRPPRALLLEALGCVNERHEALDMGAGALMDTKHLLSEGFGHVTALDDDEASWERAKEITAGNFTFIRSRFENFQFPKEKYDLVNAQRALSYVSPEAFIGVVNKIKISLKSGGIFSGQIFGNRDESILPGVTLTYVTKEKVLELFSGMEILKMEETEEGRESTLGTLKHLHEFHMIVRK